MRPLLSFVAVAIAAGAVHIRPTFAQPAPTRANEADAAAEQARHLATTPACQSLIGAAAVLVLSPGPGVRAAAPRVVHDLLFQAAGQCPDAPLASYWKGITAVAVRVSPAPTRSGPGTSPLPDQPLADVRRIMAGFDLGPDCTAALGEAAGDYLAQAAGAVGMQPALLLGDYVAAKCPPFAFDALWPAVETSYRTLEATPR